MRDDLEAARAAALAELRREPVAVAWSTDAARLAAINVGVASVVLAPLACVRALHAGGALWWLAAALLVALAVGGGVLAVRPGRRAHQLAVIGVALLLPALLVAAAHPSGLRPLLADWECGLAEGGVSAVPVIAATLALRRFSFQPLRALVGGIGAGAAGLLVLHLTCLVEGAGHVIAFHLAPFALVVAVLVVVRRRVATRSFVP
jgi:hypothetical protein